MLLRDRDGVINQLQDPGLPLSEKLKICNVLLDELFSYYSDCQNQYTDQEEDRLAYTFSREQILVYMNFIQDYCDTFMSQDAKLAQRKNNFFAYAESVLQSTLPPHPSQAFKPV